MANVKEALPTQQFINVQGVKNGVLILKGGAMRQILLVSGLNFDLKSEEEQNAITFSYQSFLNSLNFSLQIFVHSRKVNIEGYLDNLKKVEATETNPLLKTQISEYREFIKSFTKENAIMNKSFFVVVPFDPVSIPGMNSGGGGGFLGGLLSFGKKSGAQQDLAKQEEDKRFAQNAAQLAQRTEQLVAGLTQIGLRAVPLNDEEIIELLYNLYNPEAIEKKGMELAGAQADRKPQ
jgi:type IV secretory pathway VirB4 component